MMLIQGQLLKLVGVLILVLPLWLLGLDPELGT